MTFDLDERLADLRGAAHWPSDERATVLDQVLAADHRLLAAHPHRRLRVVSLAAAGLAAAACIAVPTLLPPGSPGSADEAAAVQALHHLAHVAAASPSDHLGPHQYLHVVEVDHQNALAGGAADNSRFEEWIRADGLTYQLRTETTPTDPAHVEVWLLPAGPQTIDGMTAPVYLDQLPTDPGALETYVRTHTVGSTSSDERVYVAVADIVRRNLAGPKLRSAAIDILARLGHVRLGDQTQDSLGNPVQAFEFVDPEGRPDDVRVVMFDRRTAQITEEQEYFHGKLLFTRTVPVFDVVDSVPADVRDHAVVQK
ncbi:MAG TPA: CU044_5270 family protein [Jatrophihabitans sp.]|nr:CU044_5270 family protein [Jatrophihabitans sp.]